MLFQKKTLISFIIGAVLSFTGTVVLHEPINAQTADAVAQREAELRAQLDQVLKEIEAQQKILADEQAKGSSLKRDIAILDAQINAAKLKIRAHNIAIEGLGKDINTKSQTILTLGSQIEKSRESLAQLMRKTNEIDSYSLVDVVLSNKDISEFFYDVDAFDSLQESIQLALGYIKKSKTETEEAKQTLDKKRLQEIDAKISVEAEQKIIQKNEAEKSRLLSLSVAQQKNYQSEISSKQAKAAQIRAALFSLRDTSAIPFGKALDFATAAGKATGIRPAFILAILTQESNLGQNVGSCYLSDTSTGAGVRVTTGAAIANVMKPTRDVAPFLEITRALGRDPMQTRVSCPLAGGGYGGAMGPSQFIPSTWQLFEARIAQALGKAHADPWEPQDAFMATAIYVKDLGAGSQTYSAERNAACRYYSGRACDNKSPANTFYGNQVMAKAESIQTTMIDPLSGL